MLTSRGSEPAATFEETPPNALFAGVHDDVWLWLNTEGRRLCPALAGYLPGLPDEELQASFVGASGDEAMGAGFKIYQNFKGLYERHAGPVDASTRVLDFGCGWGRVTRFFLREVDPEHLWGIDANEKAIAVCTETSRWGTFLQTEQLAPSSLPDESFDLVCAYSVFSHLSELCHASWIADFGRILRPGGVLIATTWPREYIEYCAELRRAFDLESRPNWEQKSALAFQDTESALEAYDAGRYCFEVIVQPHFGHACIPERYVREQWATHLDVVDFIADRQFDPQNVVVARRPS